MLPAPDSISASPTTPLLFKHARIFDGTNADCSEGMYLRVSDGLIQEVCSRPITDPGARVIDVGGRTLMPGLIDAHLHAYCSDVSMQKIEAMGEPYDPLRDIALLAANGKNLRLIVRGGEIVKDELR